MKSSQLSKSVLSKTDQTRYTPTHEWIIQEGEIATVGITFFSQKQLGEIVYLELPKVGTMIQANEPVVILESTKAALEVYSPASGKIIKVNSSLKKNFKNLNNLKNLNEDPEGEGWLYQIALSHPEELKKLLDRQSYFALVHCNE